MSDFIKNFMKKYRVILLLFVIVVYGFIILYMFPINETLTPVINKMQGALYADMVFGENQGIVLSGKHLADVDMVYINGRRAEDCKVIECSENKATVYIPNEIYNRENSFYIQVSAKKGGVYKFKSKKFKIEIMQDAGLKPQIVEISKAEIYPTAYKQKIVLTCENLSRDSKVFVNEQEREDAVIDHNNGTVMAFIAPDMYADQKEITIKICNMLNGVQALSSDTAKITIKDIDYKKYEHSYEFAEKNKLILHAGGEWNGQTYTNCKEAFEYNYDQGCKAFEFDFMLTSDGVIVGRHDWSAELYNYQKDRLLLEDYEINNLPKTYDQVRGMYKDKTPLTFEDICKYMSEDEDIYIITDTKNHNDEAVGFIFSQMVKTAQDLQEEEILDRLVVQVYDQDMYKKIMEIYPFKSVIYTLYQSQDTNQEVLDFIDRSNVRAITLAAGSGRDDDAFFQGMIERGCYIYVHTVNDMGTAAEYLARGCHGIYTDSIRNNQLDELLEKKNEAEKSLADKGEEQQQDKLEFNKKYIINYLNEIKDDDYIVLLSVVDEATRAVDDDIAKALEELGVSSDYRNAFQNSYVGIMSGGEKIYEAFSNNLLEYKYVDAETQNAFSLRSAGSGVQGGASICVNDVEYITNNSRGLHIVVYNKKQGIVEDKISFDLFEGLNIEK